MYPVSCCLEPCRIFCQVRFLLIRNAGLKVFSVKFVRLFIIFSIFAPFLQERDAGNGKKFLADIGNLFTFKILKQ